MLAYDTEAADLSSIMFSLYPYFTKLLLKLSEPAAFKDSKNTLIGFYPHIVFPVVSRYSANLSF